MGKTIAISTNKGGVLKTSLTVNLAGVYAKKGKVLIIDADNQGDVALSFGINPDRLENNLYNVLVDELDYHEAIYNVAENIDILPSNDEMEFFEFDILTNIKKYNNPFFLIKNRLKGIIDEYDYILIDTPPSMGLVHGNVLCFADDVLIPFQPESYSMRSLIKVLKSISTFKQEHNPYLNVLGVVGTLVDGRTVLHSQILQECRKYCMEHNIKMFDTVIPKSIRFPASIAFEKMPATLSEEPKFIKKVMKTFTKEKNDVVSTYFELEREIYNEQEE